MFIVVRVVQIDRAHFGASKRLEFPDVRLTVMIAIAPQSQVAEDGVRGRNLTVSVSSVVLVVIGGQRPEAVRHFVSVG